MSTLIGYARVSSVGQSLEVQEEQLRDAGCSKLFAEKRSGTSTKGRDALAEALDWARQGDALIVTRLDRLARSSADLFAIIEKLNAKGIAFRCLQQGVVDTTSSTGKLVMGILGAVAEFETAIRKERQRDGIDKAKAAGVYRGRKPSVPVEEVRRLHGEGISPSEIGKRLGIGRASVYRALERAA